MSVPLRSGATLVPALAAGLVVASLAGWIRTGQPVDRTAWAFVALALAVIAAGELIRLDLGDRLLAPVSTATAVGLVLAPLGRAEAGLPLAQAVFAVALGLAAGAAMLALVGRPVPVTDLAARFMGVSCAAVLARGHLFGPDLILWWQRPEVPRWLGALALIAVATVGVSLEIALWTATRSRTWRISWLALVRADLERSGAVGAIMTNAGALMAFAYPAIGAWALPFYLMPIATAVIALRRAQRIRDTQHQLVRALARLSDETGHTHRGHAQRVARLSVAVGEELGLGPLDLLAVRDAALVHDVGQVTLTEPIPDGATLGAAPAEQARVVHDTVLIIEAAGLPDPLVDAVRGSIVQFRQLREQGQTIPVTGRIVKVANAYDDLTRGRRSARAAALERIHLGLGYEYDPAVVDALARVTENA